MNEWARVIQNGTSDRDVRAVISAINESGVNGAAVMVACTQVLAQSITDASPDIAREVRAGLLALIDGYATRLAMIGE